MTNKHQDNNSMFKPITDIGDDMDNLKLPTRIKICPICKGVGRYKQTYMAGCGGGSYKSMGQCDWCNGTRFIMKNVPYNKRIPTESVLNQIQIANPDIDLSKVYH